MQYLPNILTFLRIALSFLLFWLLLYGSEILPSGWHFGWIGFFCCLIFCIASITDFFDGFIARNFAAKSVFGEIFDPLADKLLMLSALLPLLAQNKASIWAVFLILAREFFITGLRVVAAGRGLSVAASVFGKWKTGAQITAIAFLLIEYEYANWILWGATILTLYSGADYVKKYLQAK